MASIEYVGLGQTGCRCRLVTVSGKEMIIEGTTADGTPSPTGNDALCSNPSLVENVWAYGTHEFARRRTRSVEQRKSHGDSAGTYKGIALRIADYVEALTMKGRHSWCSCCFRLTRHSLVDIPTLVPRVYLCSGCGAPTTPCAAPHCSHMAQRLHGSVRLPRYCAEHRHDIRGFERANETYPALDAIDDLRTFDKVNMARGTKLALISTTAAVAAVPASFVAAPALGAALGASALGGSLTGAAATSHGLAMLGGGALATGGFGMAGGTAVVVAAGASLGAALGSVTATAYLRDDKSFRIEKLRDGAGTPVLVASGFLSEGESGWGGWKQVITKRYPQAPVYRVHWGAKELRDLGILGASGSAKVAATTALKNLAGLGGKKAAGNIPYLGAIFIAPSALANPWSVAKSRAEKTAGILADLLARTEGESLVLVGHSLGARVMLRTAELLASRLGEPRLEAVHLLGAAVGAKGDWRLLNDSVTDCVRNYWSSNDAVLKYAYRGAQLGQKAAGCEGFLADLPKIVDVDVSSTVGSHGQYFQAVKLRGKE